MRFIDCMPSLCVLSLQPCVSVQGKELWEGTGKKTECRQRPDIDSSLVALSLPQELKQVPEMAPSAAGENQLCLPEPLPLKIRQRNIFKMLSILGCSIVLPAGEIGLLLELWVGIKHRSVQQMLLLLVLELEPRTLHMLGERSTTNHIPWPLK